MNEELYENQADRQAGRCQRWLTAVGDLLEIARSRQLGAHPVHSVITRSKSIVPTKVRRLELCSSSGSGRTSILSSIKAVGRDLELQAADDEA